MTSLTKTFTSNDQDNMMMEEGKAIIPLVKDHFSAKELSSEEVGEDVSVFEDDDDDELLETTVHSSSVTPDGNSQGEEEGEKIKFTPEMTRNVFRLRLLVILVLFLAAIGVSFVVYYVTHGGETEEFKSSYDGTSSKVLEVFEGIVTEKLDAVASLSIAATAYSYDHKDEWPLCSLSFFQERATTARKQSGTLFTSVVPLVTYEDREAWENYTVQDPGGWIQEGLDAQDQWDPMRLGVSLPSHAGSVNPGYIVQDDWEMGIIRDEGYGPYFPIWQASPLLKGLVNFNLASLPQWMEEIATSMERQVVVIGRMLSPPPGDALHGGFLTRFFATMLSIRYGKSVKYQGDPFSYVFFPIFDSFASNKTAVAVMFTAINWATYFENLLPENIVGITLVLDNGCDTPYTFTINGRQVVFDGEGDLHDPAFNSYERNASFTALENRTSGAADLDRTNFVLDSNECPYSLRVYPSRACYDMHNTSTPAIITLAVACIFVFTAFMFMIYDRLVEHRQGILLTKAKHTTEILSSIYPSKIRDQLLAERSKKDKLKHDTTKTVEFLAPNHRLKSFLSGTEKNHMGGPDQVGLQPLADLFPHTTVLFADIAGFTAWSSVRDPAQVFILLQTLYGAFDALAKRRRVFKIETIGDCYVAVTGLPNPQENHAIIMTRFASDCLVRMGQLTRQLALTLGPGTDELGIRFGLHSGPVTAGVLRGDRARFQLFGDTVNTASRMESTGERNRIQVSQKTAALLTDAGKDHWLTPREDSVHAKGKGVLSTYWVNIKKATSVASRASVQSSSEGSYGAESLGLSSHESSEQLLAAKSRSTALRRGRLADWVVEIFVQYLQEIQALREAKKKKISKPNTRSDDFQFQKEGTNLDELVAEISLPKFDQIAHSNTKDHHEVLIEIEVVEQLRTLVKQISQTYRENPFHNWEHACHVTMAVHKFLQRIVAPNLEMEEIERAQQNTKEFASHLHDYTHGINSDPLTRCAILFSALIHDADHRGVSNMQLAKEDESMATLYQNKSIAEQNSLDLCWELFMSPEYKKLRQCLFADEADFGRFRQVCVNVVLATDIFDKELNDLRKARWNKAFSLNDGSALSVASGDTGISAESVMASTPAPSGGGGLRATIVIEHIIQASDVSHTMQHWHVYRKWNRCLFQEMLLAYREGRMAKDPSDFWYKGELGFFDNYIIPLARKLKDCGVFGVSSEECLNYALQNRAEWEVRGREMVQELVAEFKHDAVAA